MEAGSADPCSPSNCMSQGPSTHSLYTDVPGLVATVRELTHLQTKSPDRIQPPPSPTNNHAVSPASVSIRRTVRRGGMAGKSNLAVTFSSPHPGPAPDSGSLA